KTDNESNLSNTEISETEVKVKNGIKKVIIKTQSFSSSDVDSLVKNKAEKLQSVFVKMAKEGLENATDLIKNLDKENIIETIDKELERRGIILSPVIKIEKRGKDKQVLFSNGNALSVFVAEMELFPNNVLDHSLFISLGYESTFGAILKSMVGLTVLSLSLTVIIIFIIIFLIRQLITQNRLMQLKTNFVNNMTHELKTPIATIGLALDAMGNPQIANDREKLEQYKSIIREENKKLNAHVEKVLQQAVLEKNTLILSKEKLDINKIVSNAIAANKLAMEQKEIKLNEFEKLHDLQVIGDALHLENAI
ncbi:MAG: sensor histidine kinase, partial [Bacteroidia bacterium]